MGKISKISVNMWIVFKDMVLYQKKMTASSVSPSCLQLLSLSFIFSLGRIWIKADQIHEHHSLEKYIFSK